MNTKEQVIECLKMLKSITASTQIEKINNLITATESAIFDLPSKDDIEKAAENDYALYEVGFVDGYNFVLNYKKSEL
jgi:hypothetical protein